MKEGEVLGVEFGAGEMQGGECSIEEFWGRRFCLERRSEQGLEGGVQVLFWNEGERFEQLDLARGRCFELRPNRLRTAVGPEPRCVCNAP